MNDDKDTVPYAQDVRAYMSAIDVPAFDANAVLARMPASRLRGFDWRRQGLAAAVILAVAAWSVPAFPALIANVQTAIRLFVERDGKLAPAQDREVTLEQATHLSPFTVIVPRGVPFEETPSIHLATIPGDSKSAQLLIQYHGSPPVFSIIERAAGSPPVRLAITPRNPEVRDAGANAKESDAIRLLSVKWVQNGTSVTLLAQPGMLTRAQLEAIHRAMAR